MALLIDIGNTRIKWATLDASGLGEQHAAAYTGWTREQFIGQVLQGVRPDRVLVSNVGGARMASLVRDALEHRWSMTLVASAGRAFAWTFTVLLKNNRTRSRMPKDMAAELIQNDDQFRVTTAPAVCEK